MIRFIILAVAAAIGTPSALSLAEETRNAAEASHTQMVSRAIEFLQTRQADDGSFSRANGPGVTSLVVTGILRHGRSPQDPFVARSLEYLEGMVQPDGGIYQPNSLYRNYETCLAMMCFSEANTDGRYDRMLQRARDFVVSIQWDETEGKALADPGYGGGGYGKHKRPDLSNTSFMIDALTAIGEDADSEAIQRALIFVSRCQNLESSKNTTPFSTKVNDGGFYYTPAAGGTSQAGTTPNGGLRSYGSMTYAGLKSMIYAGVGGDDPRVKAAVEWIRRHYDIKVNPGMDDAGLYYYYHTFAKALDAIGMDELTDDKGVKHNWREELNQELARRQQANGSWINENERWLEANPDLVTGYVLLALSYTRPLDN